MHRWPHPAAARCLLALGSAALLLAIASPTRAIVIYDETVSGDAPPLPRDLMTGASSLVPNIDLGTIDRIGENTIRGVLWRSPNDGDVDVFEFSVLSEWSADVSDLLRGLGAVTVGFSLHSETALDRADSLASANLSEVEQDDIFAGWNAPGTYRISVSERFGLDPSSYSLSITIPVPEPSTGPLVTTGLVALGSRRRLRPARRMSVEDSSPPC